MTMMRAMMISKTSKLGIWAAVAVIAAGVTLSVPPGVKAQSGVPVIGSTGSFGTTFTGNFVVACNGCGETTWSPGAFTQGSWISFNQNGGSNGEFDFINLFPSGSNGGFVWFSQSTGTLNQIMSLSHGGTLTVAQVAGNAATATTAANATHSTTTGAFDHTPTTCAVVNAWAFGVAADGTPGCVDSVRGRTTTVGTTAGTDYATATATVPLSNSAGSVTMPDTLYSASCVGIGHTGHPAVLDITKGTTSITVTITNGTNSGAVASTYSEVDCTVSGS